MFFYVQTFDNIYKALFFTEVGQFFFLNKNKILKKNKNKNGFIILLMLRILFKKKLYK
jgi:hypothetical protein